MYQNVFLGSAVLSLVFLTTPTGELTGKVVDTDGGVLPGAYIYARSLSPQSPIREAVSVVDADGKFRLSNLTAGTYRVTAELTGFRSASLTRAVTAAPVDGLVLVLSVGTIGGHCFNADPLPDASLLDVRGNPIQAALAVVDLAAGGTQLHYPHSSGQLHMACFQPQANDEVRVVVGSLGSRVIKPRGVDPRSVSWRIVIDLDTMKVVR